jgi:capsular exopolysaccharide synthesis family protein
MSMVSWPSHILPDNLFGSLWRSRWFVLFSVVLALVVGFVYIEKATPIYTSTSALYVQQRVPPVIGVGPQVPQRYNLYTQAALIGSSRVIGAGLEALPSSQMQTFHSIDSPVAHLQKNLRVRVGKNDDVISISFASPYPVEAAQVVNAIVSAYQDDHDKHRKMTSTEMLDELQRERDKVGQELRDKREQLAGLRKGNPTVALELDRGNVMTQELQALSDTLARARSETIAAKLFFEGVKARAQDPAALREYVSSRGSPGLHATVSGEIHSLEARLFELQSQRQSLISVEGLTANHSRVRGLDHEAQRASARLGKLNEEFVRVHLAAAEQHYVDAQGKQEEVARMFEEQRRQSLELSDHLTDYQLLASEENSLMEYMKTIQQKVRDIDVSDDFEPIQIRVLEVARPASEPSEPQKARVMAIALVTGILMGGGLATVRGWLDQTLRSADEISATLGLRVLGVVPAMSRRQTVYARGQKVHLRPNSREAEAFRTIRTAVFFGAPDERAKTLLVTSPSAGEGKSTLVSNLAIAIAQSGQKTIVLDADFRKPTQQVIFGVNHDGRGLGDVLVGKLKLREVIQRTETKRLSLLLCGRNVRDPADRINSRWFAQLLQSLGKAYDRVLIDAPPVTVVSDAQILGAICDATILVLRADRSARRVSQRAIDALQTVGAPLLGVVVNDVRGSGGRYGYYGDYGGYYGVERGPRRDGERRQRRPQPSGRQQPLGAVLGGTR